MAMYSVECKHRHRAPAATPDFSRCDRRQPPEPIDPRRILQFGPSMLRGAKRRDAAIKVLIDRHYLLPCGGAGEARRYLLNPKGAT